MKPPRDRYIQWLIFADEDISSAHILLKEGVSGHVCFHSQQAAEKSMKGYLKAKGIKPEKTHHLMELCGLCMTIDNGWNKFEDHCIFLDKFYIPVRYPDAMVGSLPTGLPNKQQATEALSMAEEITAFVKSKLGE